MTTKITSYIVKVFSLFIILAVLFLPLTTAFAQGSEGIVLVKDVFLAVQDVEDLPDEVTFALYDSETAATPIATQTFQKGEYAVDYDFSKLDGFTFGSVARFEVNFTNTLNINGDSDTSVKIYEIWTEMEIDGTVAGNRESVSNGTLVQLLLASDASISTYLTLVYEGDDNPITTIYKDLPISSLGADGSEFFLGSYFSAVATGSSEEEIIGPMQVAGSNGQIQYNNSDVQAGASQFYYDDTNHRVGIGTTNPDSELEIADLNGGTTSDARIFLNADDDTGIQYYVDSTYKWYNYYDRGKQSFAFKNGAGTSVMLIKQNGNVGIGTTNPGSHKLAVEGTIGCRELTVATAAWSDFVFEDSYRLPPLAEVELYIQENKHLPGIPTEAEVKEKGVSVGNISSKLLQKIEELTLYVIDLKKENDSLKSQLTTIQEQLNNKHPN